MKYNLTNIKSFCKSWHEQAYNAMASDKFYQTTKNFIDNWEQSKTYELETWKTVINTFLCELKHSTDQIKSHAPKANIIQVLNLGYDEVKHSRMLAWLLDMNSTHMQGPLFFKHFLKLLNLENEWFEKCQYEVARERPDRIDLSLYSVNNFAIFIENKVRHYEKEKQLHDEYISLQKWSKIWNIPAHNRHLVFLTPSGCEPVSLGEFAGKSINISWIDVANKIRKAALSENCRSKYIQRLSMDYCDQVILHANKLSNKD